MSIAVPLYGFGASGGGSGGTLTVTAPANVTVTVSKDGKTKTKNSGTSGVVVFKGLASGTWTLAITDGSQTSSKPVVVTADYSTVIAFFTATINITYPAGSTCTCTDGTTTFAAPDTSGTWACVVPNAGTWTLSCTDGTESTSEAVTITTDGQSVSAVLSYALWLYKDGDTCDTVSGGWSSPVWGGNDFSKVVTFNESSMQISTEVFGGSVGYGHVFTNSVIDLSEISTLKFRITGIGKTSSGSNQFSFRLCVASKFPNEQLPSFPVSLSITKTGLFSVDVSSMNAGCVGVWITTRDYVKTTLTISEVWGEK